MVIPVSLTKRRMTASSPRLFSASSAMKIAWHMLAPANHRLVGKEHILPSSPALCAVWASTSLGENAARASECLHFGTRRFGVAFVCYGISAGIERRNVSRIATERRPFIQDLKRFPQTSDVVRISEPDQDRYGLGK
jgi:hypothetical protein